MVTLRAQIELAMDTGFEDAAPTAVLWFDSTEPEDDASLIQAAINDAWNQIWGGFSGQTAGVGNRTRIYDMSDPEPRAPILDELWDFDGTPSGNPLPQQCAAVVSFQGERVSGVPQARRRGRTYLGPLDTGSIDAGGYISSTYMLDLVLWAQTLLTASVDALTWNWVVHSRVNDNNVVVTNGWVENSVDIQRRRKIPANTRIPWELAP